MALLRDTHSAIGGGGEAKRGSTCQSAARARTSTHEIWILDGKYFFVPKPHNPHFILASYFSTHNAQ